MLDLLALKRYEHHLNYNASDEAIAAFRKLTLEQQCARAKCWANQRDFAADMRQARVNQDWSKT